MSQATWLHSAGTSIPSAANTTDPSGLRISLVALRKATASYGSRPAVVKRRAICIGFPRVFCGGGFGPRIQWLGAMLNPTYSAVKWAIQHVGRWRDLDTICCVIVTVRPPLFRATEGFTRGGSRCNSPRPRDGKERNGRDARHTNSDLAARRADGHRRLRQPLLPAEGRQAAAARRRTVQPRAALGHLQWRTGGLEGAAGMARLAASHGQ